MNDQKRSGESVVHWVSLAGAQTEEERLEMVRGLAGAAGLTSLVQEGGLAGIKVQVGRPGPLAPFPPQLVRPIAGMVSELGAKPFVMETLRSCQDLCRDALDLHELSTGQGITLAVTGAPFIVADGLNGNALAAAGPEGTGGWIAMDAMSADSLIVATGHDPSSEDRQGSALLNAVDLAHAGVKPTADAGGPAERAAVFLGSCGGKTLFITLADRSGAPSSDAPLDPACIPCLLASPDPVALDQASLDLSGNRGLLPEILEAASALGIGSRSYALVKI